MLYRVLVVLFFLTPYHSYSENKINKSQLIDFLSSVNEHGFSVGSEDWVVLLKEPSSKQLISIYERYFHYIDSGRLDKRLFQGGWNISDKLRKPDLDNGLKRLSELEPQIPEYRLLMKSLAKLRWWQNNALTIFGDDLVLFKGDNKPEVVQLNQWLIDIDLANVSLGSEYSQAHLDLLTDVQLQFKLLPDGRLGMLTRQALLAITNQRIKQLKTNLERLRWLPPELPYPHIWADIAGYQVSWVSRIGKKITYKAIFGKPEKQTPVFQGEAESVSINPIWKVPHKIAVDYLLRLEKKNPGRLNEEGFLVYKNWDDNAEQLDINSIDWKSIKVRNFRYRLEQQPGPKNRLGKIKLNMPNEYGIYLHDTDKPELFEKEQRIFSSGCGRVSDIASMVSQLFIEQNMAVPLSEYQENYDTKKIVLNKPVQVFFVYFTAWPDETGRVRFRDDIYELDKALVSWF